MTLSSGETTVAGLADARGGRRGLEKGDGGVAGCDRDTIDAAEDNDEKRSCTGAGDVSVLLPNGDGCTGAVEVVTGWGRRGENVGMGARVNSSGVGAIVLANEACAAARNGHAV